MPVQPDLTSDTGTFQPQWILTANDVGEPVRIAGWSDKSFGIWGTFGGTVTLVGSWDKDPNPDLDSWRTLYESDNTTAIAVTANAAGIVLENPIWITCRAGAGVVNVKVVLNCTKGGK